MKKIAALTLILISACAHAYDFRLAEEGDSWTGKDKKLHFAGSAALGLVAGAAVDDKRIAFGAAVGIGFLKEMRDATKKGGTGFSYKDMGANIAGAAVGVYAGNCLIRLQSVSCGWEF